MSDEFFFGLYRGVCTATEAPPSTRIKVKVPQLMGTAALEDWALACVPPGWKYGVVKPHAKIHDHVFTDNDTGDNAGGSTTKTLIHHADGESDGQLSNNKLPAGTNPGGHVQHQLAPKVGEGVWVMFEGGDVNHPVWLGVFGA